MTFNPTHVRTLVLLFAFLPCTVFSRSALLQTPAADSGQTKAPLIEQHHGAYLPAEGTLRALMLFVQASGDPYQDNNWPVDQIPLWGDSLVAELTNYFLAMSNGKLFLQINRYENLVYTRDTEVGYLSNKLNYCQAIKDIMIDLDKKLHFADYDNWNASQNFHVVPGPDGVVDLIIVVFRSTANAAFFPYDGVSDLGFPGYLFVDSSRLFIYGSSGYANDASASGCMITTKYRVMDYNYAFQVLIHELMHKLYGGVHPATLFAGLGVLGQSGGGQALHSLESHILSYSTYTELPYGVDTTIVLRDYVTTRDAVLVALPKPMNYLYAVEYRGKKSRYDTAPGEGVYFYRIFNPAGYSQKNVLVMSADGSYQWGLDSVTNIPYKKYPDALAGYSEYQPILFGKSKYYAATCGGDPMSSFTMDRPLFAPLHNPTPDFIYNGDTILTNMYCTVKSIADGAATVSIQYHNPDNMVLQTDNSDRTRRLWLGQNYPNPVSRSINTSMSIPFSLETQGSYQVRVFNILGTPVLTYQGVCDSGMHTLRVPLGNFPSGMYFYELQVRDRRLVQRMLISD